MKEAKIKRLIIAPWGNPYGWDIKEYKLTSDDEGVRSRTSLGRLAKAYQDADFLIFVLDTVYAAFKGNRGCEPSSRARGLLNSYKELINYVKRDIENWIKECSSSEELRSVLCSGRLEVAVVPGIGSYGFEGKTYRFSLLGGEPAGTFASWAISFVLRKLLDVVPDEVIVDLTHGLNYMPVSLMESIELALRLYVVASGKSIKLIVYETEPYSSSADYLGIFRLKEDRIKPYEEKDILALFVKREFDILQFSNIEEMVIVREQKKYLFDESDRNKILKIFDLGIPAANVMVYSMPLAASYLALEASEVFNGRGENVLLEEVCKFVEKLRDLSIEAGRIDKVSSNIEVSSGLVLKWKYLRMLFAFAALLDSMLDIKHLYLQNVSKKDVDNKGIRLSILDNISKNLGEIYKHVASQEIDVLRKHCLRNKRCKRFSKKGSEEISRNWFFGKENLETCLRKHNLTEDLIKEIKRHFIAHVGLLSQRYKLIDVKLTSDNEDLAFKYPLDCWKFALNEILKDAKL